MMKLVPHPDFPLLGKWVPSYQLIEETSDDIDYKEIDAVELQKICAFIDTPNNLITADATYGTFQSHYPQFPTFPEFPDKSKGKWDTINDYLEESDFHGYIEPRLKLVSPPDASSEFEISGIDFRNLRIKGNIKINLFTLKRIEFMNSEFLNSVEINFMGAADAEITFDGNVFPHSFALKVIDALYISIENNNISGKMEMHYNSIPLLPNPLGYRKTKKTSNSLQYNKMFIKFSKNKINHLDINDISSSSGWYKQDYVYPLEEIRFVGGNRIEILQIHTKHTTLNFQEKLKADVNRISFYSSDKIRISPRRSGPEFDRDNREQLVYGEFFSLLEAQASEQHNRTLEYIYMRKIRYFYRKFSRHEEDRFIFGWTNLISKDGTSWRRPLLWLTGTEALLAIIAYYVLAGCDLNYFLEEGWRVFLTLFAWFMNPASLLPLPMQPLDKKIIAESWFIYPLFLFQKFFAAVFYYEIVKTLRRFTR